MLVIFGGFLFWFGCSLLSFVFFFFFHFNNVNLFYFNFFFHSFFLFFLTFLLSHVAERVLVLQAGVRPEALRWKSRVQDIVPPETSQPHIISNGKSSPRDLYLKAKTQLHSTTTKL